MNQAAGGDARQCFAYDAAMEWQFVPWLLATLTVMLGAVLQAATGLGAGLIVVPLLALIRLDLVPGPVIFASLALSFTMTVRGRSQIYGVHLGTVLGGLLIGTLAMGVVLALIPLTGLGLIFGVLILLAVAISIKAPQFHPTPGWAFGAGMLAGAMGTAAGIGAPVLALLYQQLSGPRLRATLAFLYALSSVVVLGVLHHLGRFGTRELLLGLALVPGFVLGYLVSPGLAQFIDRGYARTAVLWISALSALLLIGRSLSG